jgi:hypothetical protein
MKYRDLSQAERVILPDAVASPVRGLCGPNRRPLESSDDYPDVVMMLDAKTRVIAADIQWIIQKRWGKEWRGEMFFRSKEALLMYAPKPIAPELLALPDWFPENDPARSVARPDPPGGSRKWVPYFKIYGSPPQIKAPVPHQGLGSSRTDRRSRGTLNGEIK